MAAPRTDSQVRPGEAALRGAIGDAPTPQRRRALESANHVRVARAHLNTVLMPDGRLLRMHNV